MLSQQLQRHPASYRDPSGFIFSKDGIFYRQINKVYEEDFIRLTSGGLYDELTNENLLIRHEQVNTNFFNSKEWYTTIKPEQLSFISYPFEWSFDMLKDAALLTLHIAQRALKYGLILKDATPYNLQFHKGAMILIDTLSFERYDEKEPWIAYRQFCEGFLAPLALMHYLQIDLQPLLLAYPEGIPLAVAKKLLPLKARLNLHLYLHVFLHASIVQKAAPGKKKNIVFSLQKMTNIFNSLTAAISSFEVKYTSTWSSYYIEAGQRPDYLSAKKRIIQNWLDYSPNLLTGIDTGANDGTFTKFLASKNIFTIAADSDHYAVNELYKRIKRENVKNIFPLLMDFSNPSPATGLNNNERSNFFCRVNCDIVISLAFIHHLAIGKNIPFDNIAQLFRNLGRILFIEFIDSNDEKVKAMLKDKKDIYGWYTEENFKKIFSRYYSIREEQRIGLSKRTLYLMEAL